MYSKVVNLDPCYDNYGGPRTKQVFLMENEKFKCVLKDVLNVY